MDLTPYLLQGFETLKNTTISISGYSPIDCIFNANQLAHEKDLNFIEVEDIPVIVKTSDMPKPMKSVIGKLATLTLDGNVYRIDRIGTGIATSFLYLNSRDRA